MKRLQSIYVAVGVNNLLKVGITSNQKQRKSAISSFLRKNGDELSVIEFCEPVLVGGYIESRLILHVQAILPQYSGREWFIDNGKFSDIVSVAKALTAKRIEMESEQPECRKEIRAIKAENFKAIKKALKAKVIAKYKREMSKVDQITQALNAEYKRQISKALKEEKQCTTTK